MLNKTTSLFLSGLNLVAAFTAVFPVAHATTVAEQTPTPITSLNQASLISIEQSWLRLPNSCKARSAAFDPIKVGIESIPQHVAALYAQTVA